MSSLDLWNLNTSTGLSVMPMVCKWGGHVTYCVHWSSSEREREHRHGPAGPSRVSQGVGLLHCAPGSQAGPEGSLWRPRIHLGFSACRKACHPTTGVFAHTPHHGVSTDLSVLAVRCGCGLRKVDRSPCISMTVLARLECLRQRAVHVCGCTEFVSASCLSVILALAVHTSCLSLGICVLMTNLSIRKDG